MVHVARGCTHVARRHTWCTGSTMSISISSADDMHMHMSTCCTCTQAGPAFVEVSLALGTRTDLGRPKTSTADAKRAFMSFLGASRGGPGARGPGTTDQGSFLGASRGGGGGGETPGGVPCASPSDDYASDDYAVVSRAATSETGDALLLTPGPLTTSRATKEAMLHDYGSCVAGGHLRPLPPCGPWPPWPPLCPLGPPLGPWALFLWPLALDLRAALPFALCPY